MQLTKEQELAVKDGQPVHLRQAGLDCVVIRADVYDRVAPLFEIHNPLMQSREPGPQVGGVGHDRRKGSPADASGPWTEEQNDRRCDLIDKDIEGTITESERTELGRLQQRFHEHLDTVSPPPIDGARRLHRQLLEQKRQRGRRG